MQVASSNILAPDTSFGLHPVLTSFDILRTVLLFTQVLLSVIVGLERRVYPRAIMLYSLIASSPWDTRNQTCLPISYTTNAFPVRPALACRHSFVRLTP